MLWNMYKVQKAKVQQNARMINLTIRTFATPSWLLPAPFLGAALLPEHTLFFFRALPLVCIPKNYCSALHAAELYVNGFLLNESSWQPVLTFSGCRSRFVGDFWLPLCYVSEIYPCCCMYLGSICFHSWTMSHCVTLPACTYIFYCLVYTWVLSSVSVRQALLDWWLQDLQREQILQGPHLREKVLE